MSEILGFLFYPFLACLILTGIHTYLGQHVIERQVIFVDLSLAQIAAQNKPCTNYQLELVPLWFEDAEGNLYNEYGEAEQAELLRSGEIDVLFTTFDALRRSPDAGVWVRDLNQSAGADQIWAHFVGKAGCPGKEILIFNDLAGCKIGLTGLSVSHFQTLSMMRVASMGPDDVEIVQYDDVYPAVDDWLAGITDGVAGWVDAIEAAYEVGKRHVTSAWLRNIYDVVGVSNQANTGKEEAVYWFLHDLEEAINLQKLNLGEASDQIASWQWDGHATNDWTAIFPDTAEDDMRYWSAGIAPATLDQNLVLIEGDAFLLHERYGWTGEIWQWGGVEIGEIDPAKLFELKYLRRLAEDPTLRNVGGEFVNNTYSPFPPSLPEVDPDQLILLPTLAQFGCESFQFEAGKDTLDPNGQEYADLQGCSDRLRDTVLATRDVAVTIVCHAAWPQGNYTEQGVMNFARKRCISMKSALSTFLVPVELIVAVPVLPPLERQGTYPANDPILNQDRVVEIRLTYLGGQ